MAALITASTAPAAFAINFSVGEGVSGKHAEIVLEEGAGTEAGLIFDNESLDKKKKESFG